MLTMPYCLTNNSPRNLNKIELCHALKYLQEQTCQVTSLADPDSCKTRTFKKCGISKYTSVLQCQSLSGFQFHKLYRQLDEATTLRLQGGTICCNTANVEVFGSFLLKKKKSRTCCRIVYEKHTQKPCRNIPLLTQIHIYNVPSQKNGINRYYNLK